MAMLLRWIEGEWVALCAAGNHVQPDDIYLDDAQDHAIRVKLEADWRAEGIIPNKKRKKQKVKVRFAEKACPDIKKEKG